VRHAALVEQPDCLLQVAAGGHAEAEVVQAGPVRVEAVGRGGHRPQPHDQVAARHDHAAEQELEHLVRARVAGRRRLHDDLETQQAGVELAAALHVGHCEPEMMDVAARNHDCLPGTAAHRGIGPWHQHPSRSASATPGKPICTLIRTPVR
jgi:hypothetical protein